MSDRGGPGLAKQRKASHWLQGVRFYALGPKHGERAHGGSLVDRDSRPCFGSSTSARVAPQQSPILSAAERDCDKGRLGSQD